MSPPRPTSPHGSTGARRERDLRAAIGREREAGPSERGLGWCVLTGGQTGVDTAAARAALRAGLRVHLVFPRGMRQEDGPLTPPRRRALRGAVLHELDSDSFRYRTWTCAYLADAVILIDPAGGDGCAETARAARGLGRPLLVLGGDLAPGRDEDAGLAPGPRPPARTPDELIVDFLSDNGSCGVLMIAGCRGSLLAGARKTRWARARLDALISAVAGPRRPEPAHDPPGQPRGGRD